MRIQHVSLIAAQKAQEAGCLGLTPELLAATGARYSRSNEGLDAIVSKIDWSNTEKSVDSIFRMVDYGHASIADMAPVAMFVDDISLYAAYYLWSQCPTASGQESSTRYIKMARSGVMSARDLGIEDASGYYAYVQRAFDHYERALDLWTRYAADSPRVIQVPQSVLDDQTDSGIKKRTRIIRNYAFDRARVFLPVCAKTNVMLLMSARSWVELISTLLSHPLHEFQMIGKGMRTQLAYVTPRLIKHADFKQDTADVIQQTMERTREARTRERRTDGAFLNVYGGHATDLKEALASRVSRYSLCDDTVRRIAVNFGWANIAFAEMRDLNRHRTGQKVSTLSPSGFYSSGDQTRDRSMQRAISDLERFALTQRDRMQKMLKRGDFRYMYYSLLGHTYHFEHTTTLDKFIYEAELRTGVGAHYRYAMHLRNCLKLLYRQHPELRGVILEGGADPE